jgi:hypothetical protein
MVNFLSGDTDILPAWGMVPDKLIRCRATTSLEASIIFRAAAPPPPFAGDRGLETKARNVSPLVLLLEEEEEPLELYDPHDTANTLTPMSTATAIALFKPGTPSA